MTIDLALTYISHLVSMPLQKKKTSHTEKDSKTKNLQRIFVATLVRTIKSLDNKDANFISFISPVDMV